MEKATDNQQNAHYNDEVLFLDGVIESHPEILDLLSPEERALLREYYLIGEESEVENVFEHRNSALLRNKSLEVRAKAVFEKLLRELGMEEFTYTTPYPQD